MKGFIVILVTFLTIGICLPSTMAGSNLSVVEASIATGIEDHTPTGVAESFPRDAGMLWCYSKIAGGDGDPWGSIVHRWYYGEKLMAEVTLAIRSPLYRTYSSKNILPGWGGQWRVEIVDARGTTLKTMNFTVQ
jgi:hypothetical protein